MSMVRLWQYMFWGKPHRQPLAAQRMTTTNVSLMTTVPVAILVALSLLIGVAAQPALNIAQTAAAQAIDRAGYVQTVNPALTDRDLLIPLGDASGPAKVAGG